MTALSRRVTELRANLREKTLAAVTGAWHAINPRDPTQVDTFIRQTMPVVRGAQTYSTRLAAGQLLVTTGDQTRKFVKPDELRGDLPYEEEYRRPAITLYTALSAGIPYDEALERATRRLGSLLTTDLQLAYRTQMHESLIHARHVTGYRRIIGSNEACALCLIASTRIYYKKDLLPIHPGCQCSVHPYEGPVDFHGVIDQETLTAVHDAVEERYGTSDFGARDVGLSKQNAKGKEISDYTDLVLVREHGEYGPTLTWKQDRFTGPNLIPEAPGT